MTWHGAFTSPRGSCLRPKAVCAMRAKLTPTHSHCWPELTRPQSRAWPRAVYGRPGTRGSGPPSTLAAGENRPGAFEHHVPIPSGSLGWSSDSGSSESPRALSRTRHQVGHTSELLDPDLGGSAPLTGWTDPGSTSSSAGTALSTAWHPARPAQPC